MLHEKNHEESGIFAFLFSGGGFFTRALGPQELENCFAVSDFIFQAQLKVVVIVHFLIMLCAKNLFLQKTKKGAVPAAETKGELHFFPCYGKGLVW